MWICIQLNCQNTYFFVVALPGSDKTHMVNDILYHLDIDRIHNNCPCISDDIRQIYLFGRFIDFHGISKNNLSDGTDRMFVGVDTGKFMKFIKNLINDQKNILLCE